jgi:hypothetical protein
VLHVGSCSVVIFVLLLLFLLFLILFLILLRVCYHIISDLVTLKYNKSVDIAENEIEGYLALKGKKTFFFRTVEFWERYYFVLEGSDVYYYHSKEVEAVCPCNAMQCYAMLCYAMLCYAMLCYAVLCYAMLCYAVLCYAVLCYAML